MWNYGTIIYNYIVSLLIISITWFIYNSLEILTVRLHYDGNDVSIHKYPTSFGFF